MKEKCCRNCLYFIDNSGLDPSKGKWTLRYTCQLHASEASISHPDTQFCGEKDWISYTLKTRLDNLEKLGI